MNEELHEQDRAIFKSARWYDIGINWEARLRREVPLLCEVFGPPGESGLLDAACGTGRHIVAMSEAGYRVTGLDLSAEMLATASENLAQRRVEAKLLHASFENVPKDSERFDGVYCLGNSLAATGDKQAAERSVAALAAALSPGGRMVIQILNFAKLRREHPRVRGPRVCRHGDTEYISSRLFSFDGDAVEVTNLTHWRDSGAATSDSSPAHGWRQHASSGVLYAISPEQLGQWLSSSGLRVEAAYGAYDRSPFDADISNDLIVISRK
ncbi:MAG: class I SAM-dependent methyltransferase [Planctomycetota bacterium]